MIPIYDMRHGLWSDLQKECYDRNCMCQGCFYEQYNKGVCKVKKSIIEKVRMFGLQDEVKTKQWLQD